MEAEQLNTTQDVVTPTTGEQNIAETKPVDTSLTEEKSIEQQIPADQSTTANESTPDASAPVNADVTAPEDAAKSVVEEVEMREEEPSEESSAPAATEQEKSADKTEVANESTVEDNAAKAADVTTNEDEANKTADAEKMDTSVSGTTTEASAATLTEKPSAELSSLKLNETVPEAKKAAVAEPVKNGDATVTEEKQSETVNNVSAQQPAKKQKIDYTNMPVRQYLDHTVVPILLAGLANVAKTRPEDPIIYLSNYLVEHKAQFDNNQENSSLNGNQYTTKN